VVARTQPANSVENTESLTDGRRIMGTSLRARMQAVDVSVFERVAEFRAPHLDRVLPPLSEAASYSRLWVAISLVLAIGRSRQKRNIAIASMMAVASTSAIANVAMKLTVRRRRPDRVVPEGRRLKQPGSSSFPSGHAASAAAFSGVIGREVPQLWLPVNALAATVAFSRVYTGVHYPGDVLAGWLLGKSVAGVSRRVLHRFVTSP
jgi:membrane-associated phospholipid phosphatase